MTLKVGTKVKVHVDAITVYDGMEGEVVRHLYGMNVVDIPNVGEILYSDETLEVIDPRGPNGRD